MTGKRPYHRAGKLSVPEIMTIMILFHNSGYRCLKHFYLNEVCVNLRHLFPQVVSYNRFVELEKEAVIPLTIFIKKVLLGKCTGISFVDSTPLRVCKNQRIHIHKTFKGFAARGKCSMGWFFGFKLHLICNERGELLNFMVTPGDVDDRKLLENRRFIPPDFFLRSTHTLTKHYSVSSQGNDSLLTLATPWLYLGYTLGIPWVNLG